MLTNDVDDPIRAGDITVFKIEGRDIPIVHRVIKVHEKDKDDTKFLTKGDNNMVCFWIFLCGVFFKISIIY